MNNSLKKDAILGTGWSAIERFSVQGIQFVLQIILARLLLPSDYGIIGMLAIFLQIAQVFIDSGFANALIQKQDCSENDYSTVFVFNLVVALLFYLIIFISAPLVAKFYNIDLLTKVLRVIAITLILNAFSIVQRTRLIKAIDFKSQTKVTLVGVILSGSIGILLAYKGFGVWALVWQSILNSFFLALLYFYYERWLPHSLFSKESFSTMFSFGSKVLLASIISTIYSNLYTIVIGKKFSSTELGYYTRANQFALFPSSNIANIVSRVAYPVLSRIQDDDVRLKSAYRKIICYASYVIFPLMIGLAVLADPLIRVVLTDKWASAVPLLQILCIAMSIDHLSTLNLNLLYVKGHSDYVLRLEIIKKIVAVIILVSSIPFGIIGMCIGIAIYNVFAVIMNSYYSKKLIDFGFFAQMKDIAGYLISSICMGVLVYCGTVFINSMLLKLIIGIVMGGVIYYIESLLFFKNIVLEAKQIFLNKKL